MTINLSKKLSISIPTWNRAKYLHELLNLLVSQIKEYKLENQIEIIVSDNASDDNTMSVIKEFTNSLFFIIYSRNDTNIGAKCNVLKSMYIANGEYVMLIGDDDRIRNNCLIEILNILASHNPGALIDISNFKNQAHDSGTALSLPDLIKNYYWLIGNAGRYIIKTNYVKDNINHLGYNFFNECWPHTQIIILGISKSNEKCFVYNLEVLEKGLHGELMVYTSFYLWRTCYFELLNSINDLKIYISEECYIAARYYMIKSLPQQLLNILQCGIFVDDPQQKQLTQAHLKRHYIKFYFKEQLVLLIIYLGLKLPSFIAKCLSNIFIFTLKGRKGIVKKNEFVKNELNKKSVLKSSLSKEIRQLKFEN